MFYIADNKIFSLSDSKSVEIKSRVLEDYRYRLTETIKRNEWKTSGSGAHFTNAAKPEMNVEGALSSLRVSISSLCEIDGELVYTLGIDNVCGIYKHSEDSPTDGIMISDSNYRYNYISHKDGISVVSASFMGEAHIGIIKDGENGCQFLTEGTSRESYPSFSKTNRNTVLYSGAGLAVDPSLAEAREKMREYNSMHFGQMGNVYIEGPFSIYSIDLNSYELCELISDDSQKYSYIKPFEAADGYIYYIKRPYSMSANSGKSSIGDTLMAPFRLLGAVFGFLNFFTIRYSGKTLTKNAGNTKAKNMPEEKLFIDGNIFEASKEIENNRKQGDKFPGAIPRSFELCRRLSADGKEEVIKKGVIAYSVRDNGEIICSDGLHILSLTEKNGKFEEELIIKEKSVSFIL